MEWVKKCPQCGKPHVYSRRRKERENALCKSCKKTQHYQKLRDADPRKELINGHHKYQQEKDARRRKNIKRVLGCRLQVIDESTRLEDIKY